CNYIKMAEKRRAGASAKSAVPVKKGKSPEFNGAEFKAMLKNPTTAVKGLETFVSIARKLPCLDLYDVVEGYLKISMECAEIFQLLEGEKHAENETMLVFESLEVILLRTASDLSHFNMVGNGIVRKIVSSHMKLLQGSLHSANHSRLVRHCLNLLSTMVSQGVEAAREVFSHIHIKALSGLEKRRDKLVPDVRLAFTQFALSFLVSGDGAIIGQILEVKELLPHILSSGLREDRMSTVNMILSTLMTRVVLNKAISKTQKVRFFTPVVLSNIASLYRWKGIPDATTDDDSSGVSVVRKLVHRFLLELCCSRKQGIIFHDAHFGTAGGGGNIVLLQFLVGLKQATEDELVAELVVNILKNSPDILSRYFKETQYSYTPRLKSAWQDNVNLLKKIYEAQPDISTVFQSGEMIPLSRLISMIMVISLPPVCNKTFFTQGLSLANNKVQLTTVSVINFVLKRTSKNIEYLLDKTVWERSDVYSAEMMEQLVQQYREALGKILPDMTTIISTWQSLSKKEKPEGNDNKSTSDGSKQLRFVFAVAETTEVVLLKALILQVICLYQRVMPHLVLQCKFDFSKLLKGIVSEKGMKEEVPPVLQYQMLQLALDLPASKFSWFHIQVNTPNVALFNVYFLFLIIYFFSNGNNKTLTTSIRFCLWCVQVLQDTGVFEHTWMELELWLNQLDRVKPNQQETVIQFLERVFVKLVCNSYEYTDKVASLVQEAAYLQANLNSQEGDASSLPVSHIDDVLDMLDIIMEGSEGEMEEFGPTLSEELIIQTFPFSAVVPAALEARNKLKSDKGEVCEYLSAVLSDVLHCQRDPLPLCLALLHYDKELVSSGPPASSHPSVLHLHQYYSSWLPQQSREELFSLLQFKSSACLSNEELTSNSFSTLMKAAYMQGPSTLTTNTFRKNIEAALVSMLLAEFPIAIKQVLLYIKSTVENFGTLSKETGTALLKTLMGILQDMMTKLQSFAETQNSEAAPAEEEQDASDLFLDGVAENLILFATVCFQILVAALGSIFKHPCLEQWFLALELSALPPHSLKPVRLKHLCALMTDGTLTLLQTGAPVLRDLCHAELLSGCMSAIKRAVLKELSEKRSHPPKSHSRTFQGLLSLHSYMDSSNLREVALSLLLQPQDTLICVSSETAGSDLSIYGHAALQILTTRTSMTSEDDCAFLTPAHLQGLSTLLLSCSSPEPAALMLQTLSREPSFAKLMHTDVLSRCLQEPLPDFLAINSLLLQNCSSHRLCFELWCLEPANMEKLSRETEAFLPLINTYLEVASREDPARPKDGAFQKEVLKALKQALLDKLPQGILGNLTDDREIAATVANLIKLSTDIKDFWDLISNLPNSTLNVFIFTFFFFFRWKLVDVITDKLVDYPEELEKWRKSVSIAALKCLTASFCGSKDPTHECCCCSCFVSFLLLPQAFAEDIPASEWNSFVKSGLKYRYRDSCFLNTLSSLLAVVYGVEEVQKDLLPLSTLHLMISSHSQFLPTMLGCGEEPDTSHEKEALISLLLCVVKKCPKVCNISHFVVLLGAYSATLSTSDQKLLLLLQEYERNQASLLKFQSFLWGPAAVEHHKTRKSLGASLWKQASSDELLALLKTDRMLQTISQFPQQRRIILQDEVEQLYTNKAVKDLSNLYDPCFLLPLFSVILRPECVIDCHKFISSHALGFTIMALSSSDPKVRAAAYHVLGSFYQHLEGARFREKRQMLYLMDIVKNGIQRQNQRVPFVLTSYIAKVAQQMLRPEDHMYVVLNKFLLSQQNMFKMKMEREWILNVLGEGINDDHCFELCNQQGIFQSLLGFGSSPLCDETFQILHFFVEITSLHSIHSVYCIIFLRNLTQQLLCSVVDLLCVLWFTNLGEKEKKADGAGASSPSGEKPQGAVKYLPLPFINEFLCAASAEKHVILFSGWIGKDKFRGKRYSSRTRGENSAEDDEADKQESLLRECKPSLCSIFIHWEPELYSSEAQSAVSKDRLEPRLLACDTAHLLTRWSLKWLLEDAYEDDKAKQFLLWFEKAVQRHGKMVKAVMLDPGLKADLLCLYHRSFETDSSSTATLKKFTHIMIRMLETEGQLTDYHRAVMSACIQEPSHESRQGKTKGFWETLLMH
uniref:URB1 ribosome biogenesis homolog n=1 Tax=Oryzias latipes TaxID=8090 RepID=A0A3P9IBC3_ORYLA